MSKQDKKELRQQIACEWLTENYLNYGSLRHDIVTDRLQIRVADLHSLSAPHNATSIIGGPAEDASLQAKGERQERWRNLTDKDINTMVCQCVMETAVNISVTEMWTALKSDMVPAVHPLREWLDGLRPWNSCEPDWIDFVASQVHVMDASATDRCEAPVDRHSVAVDGRSATPVVFHNESTASNASELQCSASETNYSKATYSSQSERSEADRLWRICFKKWFVAMVAGWMKDEVVNHQVLVLIGKQGIYKTTWLEHLIPPHLRAYACKLANSNDLNKDERLRIAEFGLISLDEIDSMNNRELNQLKSVITATDVNERAAYAYTKERRVRLASFCASGNRRDFLTDITGNRRWLPFEVESIQNPFYTTLPYDLMYAQAWALAQDPTFSYWFELDEIEVLEQHNQHFRDESNEEQLLDVYFAVPSTDASNAKFLTTAEISERLIYYGNIKKPMTLSRLGVLLSQKGFLSVRRGNPSRRGWIIYERENQEVNAERSILSKH